MVLNVLCKRYNATNNGSKIDCRSPGLQLEALKRINVVAMVSPLGPTLTDLNEVWSSENSFIISRNLLFAEVTVTTFKFSLISSILFLISTLNSLRHKISASHKQEEEPFASFRYFTNQRSRWKVAAQHLSYNYFEWSLITVLQFRISGNVNRA